MPKISARIIEEDTKAGVEETPIYLDKKLVAVTDDEGFYTIDNVPPGDYRIEIRPREFQYIIRDITITEDGRIIDKKTNRMFRKDIAMVRITL
jgi:hypothetical protein